MNRRAGEAGWSSYKTACFMVDTFFIYAAVQNISFVYAANSYDSFTLGYGWEGGGKLALTEDEKISLRERLSKVCEAWSEQCSDFPEMLCGGAGREDSSIPYSDNACSHFVCYLHTTKRNQVTNSESVINFLTSDFVLEIFLQSDATESIKTQVAEQIMLSQSKIRSMSSIVSETSAGEANVELLNRLLHLLLGVDHEYALTILNLLLSMDYIRTYDYAEYILPVIMKDESIAEEILRTDDKKLKKFNLTFGKKYYVEKHGWDTSLPDSWLEKTIFSEDLHLIYKFAVDYRKDKLSS